jgi:hypothetical protein
MPSNSAGSKLNTAIVPSEDAAYKVIPSQDLRCLLSAFEMFQSATRYVPAKVHDLTIENFFGNYKWPGRFSLPY